MTLALIALGDPSTPHTTILDCECDDDTRVNFGFYAYVNSGGYQVMFDKATNMVRFMSNGFEQLIPNATLLYYGEYPIDFKDYSTRISAFRSGIRWDPITGETIAQAK